MSFILDALKKSELERQRQSEPGLMGTRLEARRGGLPVWAVVVGALLGVNLIVLLVMLMRNSAPAVSPAHVKPVAEAPAATAEHFSPLDAAPVYAPEIPVAAAPDSSSKDGAQSASASATHSAAPRPLHRADPLLTNEDDKADKDEVIPSISEIDLGGSQALPELHLDVHVYATKPADRFVYINMRKYHEGSTLQEGPTIERIRRDGVVLDFHGLRFMLPRQS
jgi:general secretion pathway protein B